MAAGRVDSLSTGFRVNLPLGVHEYNLLTHLLRFGRSAYPNRSSKFVPRAPLLDRAGASIPPLRILLAMVSSSAIGANTPLDESGVADLPPKHPATRIRREQLSNPAVCPVRARLTAPPPVITVLHCGAGPTDGECLKAMVLFWP